MRTSIDPLFEEQIQAAQVQAAEYATERDENSKRLEPLQVRLETIRAAASEHRLELAELMAEGRELRAKRARLELSAARIKVRDRWLIGHGHFLSTLERYRQGELSELDVLNSLTWLDKNKPPA